MSNMAQGKSATIVNSGTHGPGVEADCLGGVGLGTAERKRGGGGDVCMCPFCKREFRLDDSAQSPSDGSSLTCNRCGYEWVGRTDAPLKCPKCGSYAWNRTSLKCMCNVCHYKWISRKPNGPSRCPNCKSSRWDEQPRKVEKEVKEKDTNDVLSDWILTRYDAGKGCVAIASELGLPLFKVMRFVMESKDSKVMPRL